MVDRITRGSRVFGGETQRAITPNQVSSQAFGDSAGQMRLAESINSAAGTVMDVAVREKKMQQAEENSQLTRLNTELGLREKKTRLEAARMYREGELETPDDKLAFYDQQMQSHEDELFGSKDFKTISKDTIMDMSRQERENYQLQYRAGELESDRLIQFKGNLANTIDSLIESAALAGTDRDINKLSAHIEEITALTGTPEFRTTHPDFEIRRDRAIGEAVQGFLKTMSDTNVEDVIALLDDDESFFGQAIDAKTRVELKQDYIDKKKRNDNEEQAAINKMNTETTQTMKLGIMNGDVGRVDIDNSGLPPGKQVELRTFLESRNARATKTKAGFLDVEKTLSEGGSVTDNANGRDSADRWSDVYETSIVDLPDEVKNELRAEKYAQISFIPPKMAKKIIRSLLIDGNDQEVEEAVDILKSLQNKNPWATEKLPDAVNATVELVNAGLSVEKSREVIQRKSQMTDIEKDYWKDQTKQLIGENPEEFIVETINAAFDWDFETKVFAIPPAAQSEYRALVNANMILTQDPDIAKTMAARQLVSPTRSGRGGWGRTKIDGTERLMKFAPEVMYGTANSEPQSDLLRKDLERSMRKEYNLEPGQYLVEFERRSLKTGEFRYTISTTIGGVMEPLIDKNTKNVIKWWPNIALDRAKRDRDIDKLNRKRLKFTFRVDKDGKAHKKEIDDKLRELGAIQ